MVARVILERDDMELVAVNDPFIATDYMVILIMLVPFIISLIYHYFLLGVNYSLLVLITSVWLITLLIGTRKDRIIHDLMKLNIFFKPNSKIRV